jgi:NADH dehydrogenase
MRVLVLGGTGFIGRHAVSALQAAGHAVVVGSRHPRRSAPKLAAAAQACEWRGVRLECLAGEADAAALLEGVEAVLNCVGILRERWHESYDAVHRRAPLALAQACRARGLPFVHVSALGLRHPHRSGFLRSKLAAEQAIVAAGGDYRIVRPSLLEGPGGFGALWLRALARLPLHFRARAARGRIAALHVDELGEALAALVAMPIPVGAAVSERLFELGGLQARALPDYLAALRGGAPWLALRVPDWCCRVASHLLDVLHFSPFSFGHWELLQHDNLPMPNRLPELLGRAPRAVGVPGATLSAGSPVAAQAGVHSRTRSVP